MTRRLCIRFERADEFQREFDRNISKGGAFVPGAAGLELREVVEVEILLAFSGQQRTLEAEVVHVIGAPAAPARDAAGAAVQFLRPASEVRDELAGLLGVRPAPASRPPAASAERWQLDDLEIGGTDLIATDELPVASDELLPVASDELLPELVPGPSVERRGSSRSPARVIASLDGANARIEGVTRDLSETGALISADASELPPGKRVRLALQHPETGQRVEVDGRVVRHVETEGTVAAVSVLFDVPDEGRKDELAALVRDAQSAHRRRSAGGISGQIEELGMPSLIQMLGRSSPHGTLTVRNGAEEGVLAFEGGNLRYVRLGATRSLKALSRMLLWREGHFEFHAHVATLEAEDEPIRLEAALLEATRRLDEAGARPARFDPTQRFRVDRAALASAGALSKTEEAVLDLAAARFTVRRILDVIPEDDAEVSAALLALVERGVLTPAG